MPPAELWMWDLICLDFRLYLYSSSEKSWAKLYRWGESSSIPFLNDMLTASMESLRWVRKVCLLLIQETQQNSGINWSCMHKINAVGIFRTQGVKTWRLHHDLLHVSELDSLINLAGLNLFQESIKASLKILSVVIN